MRSHDEAQMVHSWQALQRGDACSPSASSQEAHMDLKWWRWYLWSSCLSLAITKYLVGIHSETVQNTLFLSLDLSNSFSIQWGFLIEIIITMWVAKWWIHQPHFLFICLQFFFIVFNIFYCGKIHIHAILPIFKCKCSGCSLLILFITLTTLNFLKVCDVLSI